jgi:hypothetical protein
MVIPAQAEKTKIIPIIQKTREGKKIITSRDSKKKRLNNKGRILINMALYVYSLMVLLFQRNGFNRTAVNCFLAVAVSAFFGNNLGFSLLNLKNLRTKRLAGSATNAKLFIDLEFRHNILPG